MMKLLIIYYSKGGNTRHIADYFRNQLQQQFQNREIQGDIQMFDALHVRSLDLSSLKAADGFVFGSPDYFGYVSGYIKAIFDEIYSIRSNLVNRPSLGYISHGGGGNATQSLNQLIQWNKLNLLEPVFSIKGCNITNDQQKLISHACDTLVNHIRTLKEG